MTGRVQGFRRAGVSVHDAVARAARAVEAQSRYPRVVGSRVNDDVRDTFVVGQETFIPCTKELTVRGVCPINITHFNSTSVMI